MGWALEIVVTEKSIEVMENLVKGYLVVANIIDFGGWEVGTLEVDIVVIMWEHVSRGSFKTTLTRLISAVAFGTIFKCVLL